MNQRELGKAFLDIVENLNAEIKKLKHQLLTQDELSQLSMSQLYYIKAIYKLGSPTFGQLAEELQVAKPSVTNIINKLISGHYIEKRPSSEDGRVVYLRLTEKGMRLIELHNQVYDDFIDQVTDHLSTEELEQLTSILQKITVHFSR